MFFVFEASRFWVRSSTHTVVLDRDPDFERLARSGRGRVRTYVHVWLRGWRAPAGYIGGLWARRDGLRDDELRPLNTEITRRVGRDAGRPLRRQLARQLEQFRADRTKANAQ